VKQFPESFSFVQGLFDCISSREIVRVGARMFNERYRYCESVDELRERICSYDIYWLCRMGWAEWMKTFPLHKIISSSYIFTLLFRYPDLAPCLCVENLCEDNICDLLYYRPEMHSILDLSKVSKERRDELVRIHPDLEEVFRKWLMLSRPKSENELREKGLIA
jgi:hypothetical protein